MNEWMNEWMRIFIPHISNIVSRRFIILIEWDRTSACKGASGRFSRVYCSLSLVKCLALSRYCTRHEAIHPRFQGLTLARVKAPGTRLEATWLFRVQTTGPVPIQLFAFVANFCGSSNLANGGCARSTSGSHNLAVLTRRHDNETTITIFLSANKNKD